MSDDMPESRLNPDVPASTSNDDMVRPADAAADDMRAEDMRAEDMRGDEMRSNDLRSDAMRSDRTGEPRGDRASPAADRRDMATPITEGARAETPTEAARDGGMWPAFADYRDRFHRIEMDFIEEPKEAVKRAESLVQEAVERMTTDLRERVRGMHSNVDGESDTERLRILMLDYRQFIDSMGGRRVA